MAVIYISTDLMYEMVSIGAAADTGSMPDAALMSAEELAGVMLDQTGKHKVLLILDGLDETRGWAGEEHTLLFKLMSPLQNFWKVIMAYIQTLNTPPKPILMGLFSKLHFMLAIT